MDERNHECLNLDCNINNDHSNTVELSVCMFVKSFGLNESNNSNHKIDIYSIKLNKILFDNSHISNGCNEKQNLLEVPKADNSQSISATTHKSVLVTNTKSTVDYSESNVLKSIIELKITSSLKNIINFNLPERVKLEKINTKSKITKLLKYNVNKVLKNSKSKKQCNKKDLNVVSGKDWQNAEIARLNAIEKQKNDVNERKFKRLEKKKQNEANDIKKKRIATN